MDFIFGLVKFAIFVAVVMGGLALWKYNALQRLAQEVKERASNVEVTISKRVNLINQLIDVVKNHQEGEQFTLLKISQDNAASNLAAAYQQSGNVLASLQAMAERFPDLKSSQQYHRLMDAIQSCESEIQDYRQRYNAGVKEYNSTCLSFPTVLVSKTLGFSSAPYLEFDVSGHSEVTRLKDFKTDDGERLQQLLSNAGGSIAGATRTLAGHAGQAGKLLAARVREQTAGATGGGAATYFYHIPGAVPRGPVTMDQLRELVATGAIDGSVMIAQVGSEDWKPLASMPTLVNRTIA